MDASDIDADSESDNLTIGDLANVWIDKVGGIRLSQSKESLQPQVDTLGEANRAALKFDGDFLSGATDAAKFLSDKKGSIVVVYSATHSHEGYGFEVGGDNSFVATFINPSARDRRAGDEIERLFLADNDLVTKEERQTYRFLSTRDRFVKQHLKRLRPVAMSLRHSYGPPYEPGVPTSRIMIRGEYDNPGKVVEPGFLTVIAGKTEPTPIRLDPFKRWPMRSRRMALADWIASKDNPMTHRVMVNRLWYWLFGQGIVRTPSDFGYLSDGPSHRELLDWLALRFVEKKWSVKSIQRLIVNSSAYRQSSNRPNAKASEIDPDNRLLWRSNRRRLEAEEIRDSILTVSGRLNTEQFGLPIFPPLPGDVAEAVKYSESKWDTQYGVEGRRRSIYIYQQRTLTMPFMQTFDSLVCDESRPRRRTSVTPLQALAMYNGEFVNEEAKHFASRLRAEAGEQPARQIDLAFQISLGRHPSATETKRMSRFLKDCDSTDDGLTGLCRILLNTNEFSYID